MDELDRALAQLANRRLGGTGERDFESAGNVDDVVDTVDADPNRWLSKHEGAVAGEGARNAQHDRRTVADIAILVALPRPELDYVLRTFADNWRQESRDGVVYDVGSARMGTADLSIVAAVQNDMGMVPASILATKTLSAWQPRLLAMVGICAGARGKVELGDVVVAQQIFDYGSGKLSRGRLTPDYTPVSLDEHLCSLAKAMARDKNASARVREAWTAESGKPSSELTVHVGSMASGAAVVGDDNVVAEVEQHKRSLLAVDMEAYGLARAAVSAIVSQKFMVVKGVQDFADSKKSDRFREYAAFASARWLHAFLHAHWDNLNA